MSSWEPSSPEEAERDRRTGLARVLAAIADVSTRLAGAEVELARLHERLDRLDATVHFDIPADEVPSGDGVASLDHVRRTVAASHRALATQLAAMVEELRAENARELQEVALDVEAIRRAIERAGGATR